MAGPWEDFAPKAQDAAPWDEFQQKTPADVAKAAGLPADFPIHTPGESRSDWWKKELVALTKPQAWTRQAKLAGRAAIEGVESIPLVAMDMGVSGRNMLTGSNYQMPSQMNRESINSFLPESRTPQEKTAGFVEAALAGSRLPVPQAAKQAPANFVKPSQDLLRQQTLAASQKAGYVVPPSTTNPTAANTFMESFGGKIATAQDAALRNQEVTNRLAKSAVGLSEDAPLTPGALSAVRSEAGDAYKVLRGVGPTSIDAATTKSLDDIASKFTGSKLKAALGEKVDIPKIVQAIKDEPLTGDTAVDSIDLLRSKADAAYRAGEKEVGKAYKGISKVIEDLMEKQLSGDALKNFREARQLMAKTHTVEGALNQATGNVVAQNLAAQLDKGKPLSGELKTAAQFGMAFPKAAKEMVDSGAVRNTDAVLGSGAAVFTGHPWYLGWPFLRQAARSYLLSSAGQGAAMPSAATGASPQAVMGLLASEEQIRQNSLKKK